MSKIGFFNSFYRFLKGLKELNKDDEAQDNTEIDKQLEALGKKGKLGAVLDYTKFFKPLEGNGLKALKKKKGGMKSNKNSNLKGNLFKMKCQNMSGLKPTQSKKSPLIGIQSIMNQKKSNILQKAMPGNLKKISPFAIAASNVRASDSNEDSSMIKINSRHGLGQSPNSPLVKEERKSVDYDSLSKKK